MPTLSYVEGMMKIRFQIAIASLLFLIHLQDIECGAETETATSGVRWNCTCSSTHHESQDSIVAANCSASCDCESAGTTGNRWICICNSGLLPIVTTDDKNNKCFTACNCTSGSFTDTRHLKKHISSRIVVITLLICLVLTTLALAASIICYFYQRQKYKPQRYLFDKGCSYNSDTHLIRHKPVRASRINFDFLRNHISGCIRISSLLLERRILGTLHSTVIHFPYSELEHATNKFSEANLIGVGGSSHVYRGLLKEGRIVAVKRLKTSEGLYSESEFLKEVEIMSRLHHIHIVPLLGYCSISQGKLNERLLVFEYLPNGNLRDCLDGASEKRIDWSTRVSIALGVARGLEYLHEAAAPRILHRDVKSTNILLDENWKPKVTDLGMAKRITNDGFPSCSSSPDRMQGTFGYFAPEYAIVGKGSLKSDVFSFGVVLLELITGRTPIFRATDKGDESLVIWAAPCLQNSTKVISELPDPHLNGNFLEEEMQIVAYLAKECLLLDPESRPTMSEVVQILSTIAPDMSRRRRFSINLIENFSSRSTKSEQPVSEKWSHQVEVPIDSEEIKQLSLSRWSSPCSYSSDMDRTLFTDSVGQGVHLSSTQCIDSLLFLTSSSKHWNANNVDDIVDLTEPRLETFCVGNSQ